MTTMVWYAAYGSNMLETRFLTYLHGGSFDGGAAHRGARDDTPARDDTRLDFPCQLFFAHESSRWDNGGVAFVDPDAASDTKIITRAYLITSEQFEDVVAQENGWRESKPVLFGQLIEDGRLVHGSGWYDLALCLGRHESYPVLTFTSSTPIGRLPVRAPAPAYLTTLCRGLCELGVTPKEITSYLEHAPGIANLVSREDLYATAEGACSTTPRHRSSGR